MHKLKKLLNLSSPRRGLKEEIWKKLQPEDGYALPRLTRPLIFQPVFLILTLVLLSGFGTGVYAHQSPAVQQGHPLNSIKHSLEAVQVRLARSPEAQAQARLGLAKKRLREIEHQRKRGVINPRGFNQADIEIEQARELLPLIKNEKKRQAISNHLDQVRVLRVKGGQDAIKLKPQVSPGREVPQIKLKDGKRLNYLDYPNNLNWRSKPEIKYDQTKTILRRQSSSFDHAGSRSKLRRQTPDGEKNTK